MKKRLLIIVIAIILLAGLGVYCSTWRINMAFDNQGDMVDSSSGFTISFEGSDRYTDKELATFLFGEDTEANPLMFWWNKTFGEPVEIPFIEEYEIEMEGFFDYKVTFYEKSVVGYVTYMGTNQYFDKDGIVVESSSQLLEGVPYVTGIDVDYIVLHEELPVEDERIFDILLDVTQLIKKYGMPVDKINVSDDMDIRLYLGDVRVDFGNGDMLNEKFMDLNDIIPQFNGVKGVLDMEEYDAQDNGYTFRRDE